MNNKLDDVAPHGSASWPQWLGQAFAVFAACVLVLSLSSCIGNDWGAPAIHGVLVEQGSNKPLAGAIAVARWEGIPQSLGGHSGACVHIDTAITDAEGKFVIPAWQLGETWRGSSGVKFYAGTGFPKFYLRGYKQIIDNVTLPLGHADKANMRKFFMEPDLSAAPERLERLGLLGDTCSMDEGGNLSTNRLNQAMYDEAKEISTTSERDQLRLRVLFTHANRTLPNNQTVKPTKP